MKARVIQYLLNTREGLKKEAKAAQRAFVTLGLTMALGTIIAGSIELNRAANAD